MRKKFDIYADLDNPSRIGEVTISYDRIISAYFKIPVKKKKQTLKKIKGKSVLYKSSREVFEVYELNEACVFSLEKISRAEWPYQRFQLTHQLHCTRLLGMCDSDMYIKLSAFQLAKINYHHKKYLWQASTFRQKLFEEGAKWILIALLSTIMSLLVLFFSQEFQEHKKDPIPIVQKGIYREPIISK